MRQLRRPFALLLAASLGAGLAGCTTSADLKAQQDAEAQKAMSQANQYLEQGLDDSALAAFSVALEHNPELTDAHKGMGGIWKKRGQYADALNAFTRATQIDPGDFSAQYEKGLMHQLLGDVQLAIRTYLTALAIDPDSPVANRELASAYLQMGRPNEALPYAQRSARLDPDSQPAWANLAATYSLLGRYDEAVAAYREAAELGDLGDPVYLGLADAHIKLGNYDLAINVLQSLIRRSPSPTAHERLGYAMFKHPDRRYEQALRHFSTAVELNPNDTAALNGVGVTRMTLFLEGGGENKYHRDRAIDAWRRSLQINGRQPHITDLLSQYGQAYGT